MIGNSTTSPLRRTALSSYRPTPMNWRQKGVGIARIIFGLVWVVDAILKWQPQFQNTFVDQVTAARDGQTGLIQGWLSFWAGVVTINPLLFARIEATTETALAVFLILGIFSNLTFITGIFLSLGIWAIPEGLGGPYVPGQNAVHPHRDIPAASGLTHRSGSIALPGVSVPCPGNCAAAYSGR